MISPISPDIIARAAKHINTAVAEGRLPAVAANPFGHTPEQRKACELFVRRLAREGQLGSGVQDRDVSQLLPWLIGMGPLDPLLEDEAVVSVQVQAHDDVWVFQAGAWIQTDVAWESADVYRDYMRALAARSGTALTPDTPVVQKTFRAPTGRLQIDATAQTPSGITMHVRMGRQRQITLGSMLAAGGMSVEMYEFLQEITLRDIGALVVGLPGSGKTTLLEAMIALWPPVPAVALDDMSEFQPRHPMCVLYNLPSERLQDGFIWALRKNTQRVALAEVRGDETAAMLKFSGALVVWTTLHGSVDNAVVRLMALAQGAPGSPYKDLAEPLVKQVIGAAFPLIIETGALSVGGQTTFYIARIAHNQGAEIRTLFEAEIAGPELRGYRRVNDPADFLRSFPRRTWASFPPPTLDTLVTLADTAPVGALRALEQMVRANPTDADARMLLRRLAKDHREAKAYVTSLVERYQRRSAVLYAAEDWAALQAWYARIDGDPIAEWLMQEAPRLREGLRPISNAALAQLIAAQERAETTLRIRTPAPLAALWGDIRAHPAVYPDNLLTEVTAALQAPDEEAA
jgi:pilus assembly protein CpaF